MLNDVLIRPMLPDEFAAMRALSIAAFEGDGHIGALIDELHSSWCWDDDLSFVAELNGDLVGQALYTKSDPRRAQATRTRAGAQPGRCPT